MGLVLVPYTLLVTKFRPIRQVIRPYSIPGCRCVTTVAATRVPEPAEVTVFVLLTRAADM